MGSNQRKSYIAPKKTILASLMTDFMENDYGIEHGPRILEQLLYKHMVENQKKLFDIWKISKFRLSY